MSDRKYRPVYMFIFMGLMLMVIMMNYSFIIFRTEFMKMQLRHCFL